MPDRDTPKYYALILLDQILLHGNDSRLYQALVQQRGYFDGVSGGINAVPPSKRAKLPANTCGPKP